MADGPTGDFFETALICELNRLLYGLFGEAIVLEELCENVRFVSQQIFVFDFQYPIVSVIPVSQRVRLCVARERTNLFRQTIFLVQRLEMLLIRESAESK